VARHSEVGRVTLTKTLESLRSAESLPILADIVPRHFFFGVLKRSRATRLKALLLSKSND
jgi:hypothetical protein